MPEDKRNSAVNGGLFTDVPAFVQGLAFAELPADVVAQARRCLLDLIGVAAAGSRTSAAQIVNHYAATQLLSSETEARMLFDGRRASPAGAAFASATTIDSFDANDGHVLIKGHAGVVVLPTLLAMVDSGAACDDREFITELAHDPVGGRIDRRPPRPRLAQHPAQVSSRGANLRPGRRRPNLHGESMWIAPVLASL